LGFVDLPTCCKNGHLEVLKWARTNGCDCDLWPCIEAAKMDIWKF